MHEANDIYIYIYMMGEANEDGVEPVECCLILELNAEMMLMRVILEMVLFIL